MFIWQVVKGWWVVFGDKDGECVFDWCFGICIVDQYCVLMDGIVGKGG